MEFLGKLGIDIKLLIAQIINFGILLFILSKLVYRPIVKRIEKDEEDLNYARKERQSLEKEEHKFEEEKQKKITQSRKEARKIIKEAESIAETIRKRAKMESEKEKRAVLEQIKARLTEIENEKKD